MGVEFALPCPAFIPTREPLVYPAARILILGEGVCAAFDGVFCGAIGPLPGVKCEFATWFGGKPRFGLYPLVDGWSAVALRGMVIIFCVSFY